MSDLPRRPFTELSPPDGGFAEARRAGRRRRRLKATAASTTGAGAVAVVLAIIGSSSLGGQDSLRVTGHPDGATPAPSASASDVPSRAPVPGATNDSASGQQPGATSSPNAAAGPEATAEPAATTGPGPAVDGYRTPDLVRNYFARPAPLGSGTSFCQGASSDVGDNTHSTVNWCHSAIVKKTAHGHELTDELCRDGTSGSKLVFSTSREVELLVMRGTEVVWRWSADHPADHQPHELVAETDHCWQWTASWTDVDARGRPLPAGDYRLRVISQASEKQTQPETTFTI
ncbi:MAG: hypothetical protein QOE64_1644 [Frankiales bacterium]|nr:hypothetical protein [Frankiales bacterium]